MHHRDVYYDMIDEYHINGFKENLLVASGSGGGKPCFVNKCVYILLTMLTLGWIQRIMFIFKSKKVGYDIKKYILA